MKAKTLTLLVIALLIFLSAVTVNAATVNLTPRTVYETTKVWETLNVNNYGGNSLITKVAVSSPNLAITNAKSYLGWTTSFDADSAEWKNGIISTNIKSAVFEFQVSAPKVSQDTTVTITSSLDSGSSPFNVTILNDPTPPNITELKPSGYAKANNPSQAINAKIIDAETGVASAKYAWSDCSGNDTTITLTESNGTHKGVANFASYDEGSKACYSVTATNNAGETAKKEGELLFDGTAPTVEIISPTSYATETTEFKFKATDNLAKELECIVELDGTALGQISAKNGQETSVTHNLTSFQQGKQTWSVTCTDGVGLSATDEQEITLDTEAPEVTMKSEAYLLRTQPTEVKIKITDLLGVKSVNATFEGESISLNKSGDLYTGTISSDELGSKLLVIEATDEVGHATTKSINMTVVPNHQLTLALSSQTTLPGKTITASGTLTAEGNITSTSVTIKTPSGDEEAELQNGAYSITFKAPNDAGTYTIITEYDEVGYTYTAKAKLTVQSPGQSDRDYSAGYESSWSGGGSYVKPEDAASDSEEDSNAVTPDEPEQKNEEPETEEYSPLPAEEPRGAITPKATGVFSLGKTIKWTAILLALALIGGLGAYAYYKRPPKQENTVNWDGYFGK